MPVGRKQAKQDGGNRGAPEHSCSYGISLLHQGAGLMGDLPHCDEGNSRHAYSSYKNRQQKRKHTSPSPTCLGQMLLASVRCQAIKPKKSEHGETVGTVLLPREQAALL